MPRKVTAAVKRSPGRPRKVVEECLANPWERIGCFVQGLLLLVFVALIFVIIFATACVRHDKTCPPVVTSTPTATATFRTLPSLTPVPTTTPLPPVIAVPETGDGSAAQDIQ